MGWLTTWIAALATALAGWLALTPAPAHAQAGMTGRPVAVCIAPVRAGERFADLIAGRVAVDCHSRQTSFGAGDFWAVSEPLAIPAPLRSGDLRLRVGSLWQQGVTIGIVHAGGHVDWLSADSRQFSRHIQLGAVAEFVIPAGHGVIDRIVWRIDGAANRRDVIHGVRIATEQQSELSNLYMAMLYAGFIGLIVALFIYNLALWGALRHDFQLAYCLMLGLLLAYALSSSGMLAWMFDGIDNNDRLRLNYLSLAATAAATLRFTRKYFEPRIFDGGLDRLIDVVSVGLLAIGITLAVMPTSWIEPLDFAYSLAFGALISVLPLIIWRAHVERSRYLWMFGLAWTAPILMAATRLLSSLHVIPWRFWIDNSTLLAMGAEALISSLAIAYRIRMLSHERDRAVAEGAADRLLAATDPLTGLLNRRAFLETAIGRAGRQQLVLLDIDHFKRVNETLGHDGGDEVLRVVARVLRQVVPASGLVARIGGEEFALVADLDDALDPDRVLAALRATRMPFDLTVTGSIGTCNGPLSTEIDWKILYRVADRALYDAKAGGRDRARTLDPLAIAA